MNTKPENISCRPGTTEAMERLAAENEALRAELESTANLAIKQGEWLQAIVNITKGKPEGLKHHTTYDVVESVEALRVERNEALARAERLNEGWSLFSDAMADISYCRGADVGFICGDHADNEGIKKIHEGRDGSVSVLKLARAMIEEAPAQSLAHIKAAGAREALQRAIQTPGFSDTVVRVDRLEAAIADMESE